MKSKSPEKPRGSRMPKYQLLPKLRDEEYAALEADIRRRGVLIPVEKDEDGEILDGHNRAEIADRLGIQCPEVIRRFTSEREKREHIIKINLARRHLDPLRWGQTALQWLEERGGSKGPGRPKASDNSATVAELSAELGVPQRTAEWRLEQARTYEKLPEPIRKKVDDGKLTVPQAKQEVVRQQKRIILQEKTKAAPQESDWRVIHGECTTWLDRVKIGTPRIAFADPPYNIGVDYGDGGRADSRPDHAFLDWCQEWMAGCHRALSDDGSLWVLINDEYADHFGILLRRVGFHRRAWIKWYEAFGVNCSNNFNRTSRHLFYCVKDAKRFVFHPDAVNRPSARQVVYNDGRAAEGGKLWDDVWAVARLSGTCNERIPDFPTQLPLALLRPIVRCASDPGDLVLDPFSGSGTTGAACIESGRRFVGIEKQRRFVDLSTLRLKGVTRDDAVV